MPEPFAHNFPEATYIEDWEEFERKARDELPGMICAATFTPIAGENDDEVQYFVSGRLCKMRTVPQG